MWDSGAWCIIHLMKIKDKKTGRFVAQPLEDRFWEKVDKKPDGCWNWKGYTDNGKAYGRLRLGKENKIATHVSWFIHTGKWPNKYMCHKCDNPPCVNPEHLFEGTHWDNMEDKVKKGRQKRGQDIPNAILNDGKVKIVKSLLKYLTPRMVEEVTGVSYWSIIKIKNNKQWKHVK